MNEKDNPYDLLFQTSRQAEYSIRKLESRNHQLENQLKETKAYYDNLLKMTTQQYKEVLAQKQYLEGQNKHSSFENEKHAQQANLYLAEVKKLRNQLDTEKKFWDTCFNQMKNDSKRAAYEKHTLNESLQATQRENKALKAELSRIQQASGEHARQAIHYREQLKQVTEKLEARLSQLTLMRNQVSEMSTEIQDLQSDSKRIKFKLIETEAVKKELETLQDQVLDAEKEYRIQFADHTKRYQEYISRELERLTTKETKLGEIVHSFHKLKSQQERIYSDLEGSGKQIRRQAIQHIDKIQELLQSEKERKEDLAKKIMQESLSDRQKLLEKLQSENASLKKEAISQTRKADLLKHSVELTERRPSPGLDRSQEPEV